jgi:hypothetical protein
MTEIPWDRLVLMSMHLKQRQAEDGRDGGGWNGGASCSESSTQFKSSGRLFYHENKHEENNNGGIIFRLQHIMACLILNTKLS